MDNPPVIEALRRLAGPGPDDVSDSELLTRFVTSQDGTAFEALVRRHGRLVWGACRRRLRDLHAAEDAFQTTFLALARHAAEVRRPEALGAWLHRVAVRCAAAFRTPRYHMPLSSLDTPARDVDPAEAASALDLERAIDCEIDALPEPFRLAYVLCEVEQRTAADAAKTLGCAVGTIESRLTRARQWLRARLTRRGITVGTLAGASLVVDSVPATARAGAVSLATGSSAVPTALVPIADRAVRFGLRTVVLGIGLASSASIITLGGLLCMFSYAPHGSQPIPQASNDTANVELQIPESERFRRNRDNFPLPPEAIARVGDAWLRHGAIPQRMAFSADGRFLATAGAGDRWLRVWDLETKRPRAHLALAEGEVPAAIALTDDGRTLRALVCTGETRTIHLREYDTYRALETHRRLIAGGPVSSAAFSQNGARLGISRSGNVRMLDATNATEIWHAEIAPDFQRVDLAISQDGKRIATVVGGSDRIQVLDVETGRVQTEIADSGATLSLPTLSADGRRVAAWCSTTQRIRIWNVGERQLARSVKPQCLVTGLSLAPDGSAVAAFSSRSSPVLWPVNPDGRPRAFDGVFGGVLGQFSTNGDLLAVASMLMAVQLVEPKAAWALPPSPRDVMPPRPVAFVETGNRLLVEGFQAWIDYPLRGDDPPSGFSPGIGQHETTGVMAAAVRAAISPDRTLIARCTRGDQEKHEFSIDLLDACTRELRGRIALDQSAWRPVFSPDGAIVYAITSDGYIRGWKVKTGQQIMRSAIVMAEQVSPCTSQLIVSPNSEHIAYARMVFARETVSNTIRVFDTATGEQRFAVDAAPGDPHVAFLADGRWFAAAVVQHRGESTQSMLSVCNASTGRIKFGIPGLDGQPAFSPDGRMVAVTHDHGVVLIELATGQVRHEFQHHGKVEPALAWQADGRVLAAASPEAPVYLWDIVGNRTGNPVEWKPANDDVRWANLCDSDASAAFRSLRQLWAHPDQAVAFLKARISRSVDARVASRVCEALELIRTPDARALLVKWAASSAHNPLSNEANCSLKRLPPL